MVLRSPKPEAHGQALRLQRVRLGRRTLAAAEPPQRLAAASASRSACGASAISCTTAASTQPALACSGPTRRNSVPVAPPTSACEIPRSTVVGLPVGVTRTWIMPRTLGLTHDIQRASRAPTATSYSHPSPTMLLWMASMEDKAPDTDNNRPDESERAMIGNVKQEAAALITLLSRGTLPSLVASDR